MDGAPDGSDTDMDGVSDVDELESGTNPALPGPVRLECPRYGCGARIVRTPPRDAQSSVALLGAAALFAGLRRGALTRARRRARAA